MLDFCGLSRRVAYVAEVTFREKLDRLIGEQSRASVGRDAGVAASVLTTYINRGSEPSAANALKLARSLKVDLAWLVDDDADWPAPPPAQEFVALVKSDVLMAEVARRYRREALAYLERLERLRDVGVPELRRQLEAWENGEVERLPPMVLEAVVLLVELGQIVTRWSVDEYAAGRHTDLPGGDRASEELQMDALLKSREAVFEDNEFMAKLFGLLSSASAADLLKTRHRSLAQR